MEMNEAFEIAIVVPRRNVNVNDILDKDCDCVEVLVSEVVKVGLKVDSLHGVSDEFIKLAAPLEVIGRTAAKLHMKKPTHIGMDLQFEWEEVDAFVRQPDGSLFSWCERYRCYCHLIYSIVNHSKSDLVLQYDDIEVRWKVGESLLRRLESEKIVKQVFPLHVETKRKMLLRSWALKFWDFTTQPIDDIHSYFGMKIATYFTFLGMYTRWLFFPAAFGLLIQFVDFGALQVLVIPIFFASVILWAVSFFQFWKRKNCALLARWQINNTIATDDGSDFSDMNWSSRRSPAEIFNTIGADRAKVKEEFRKYEWIGHLLRFRNDVIIITLIICLQFPFELTYAHLYEVIGSCILKFALTAIYLFAIQHFTELAARISVKLIKHENNESIQYRADSLVYKVFGLYFMQTYIGVFYHILLHRDFATLRQVLIQRLIISEVFENLGQNCLPYIKYRYTKYKAVRNKKKSEDCSSAGKITSRVEKEYLKPAYSASIGYDLEDGLFDDFLELALQFGMIMMFACAFPPAFAFAALTNITEIRTDALRLLTILRRPTPRAAATIGAWLNIFQFLIVMSICTNSALLVWMYDHEGKWKIEPGLAAILILEHILLLIKFGISHFVPEEPAWVKASRVKNETHAQDVCSKQLLRSISGVAKAISSLKRD